MVCDGHGTNGHFASQLITNEVPLYLNANQALIEKNPKAALFNAVEMAN